jgi:hypothetical protein
VEFFIAHVGPLRTIHRPVALRDQHGIAALPLAHLGILERHTTTGWPLPMGLAASKPRKIYSMFGT